MQGGAGGPLPRRGRSGHGRAGSELGAARRRLWDTPTLSELRVFRDKETSRRSGAHSTMERENLAEPCASVEAADRALCFPVLAVVVLEVWRTVV